MIGNLGVLFCHPEEHRQLKLMVARTHLDFSHRAVNDEALKGGDELFLVERVCLLEACL